MGQVAPVDFVGVDSLCNFNRFDLRGAAGRVGHNAICLHFRDVQLVHHRRLHNAQPAVRLSFGDDDAQLSRTRHVVNRAYVAFSVRKNFGGLGYFAAD